MGCDDQSLHQTRGDLSNRYRTVRKTAPQPPPPPPTTIDGTQNLVVRMGENLRIRKPLIEVGSLRLNDHQMAESPIGRALMMNVYKCT